MQLGGLAVEVGDPSDSRRGARAPPDETLVDLGLNIAKKLLARRAKQLSSNSLFHVPPSRAASVLSLCLDLYLFSNPRVLPASSSPWQDLRG